MSESNTTPKYFDLHITGMGYLNDAREVKPVNGSRRFDPFFSVRIAALHGNADAVNYTYFDAKVVGAEALAVIKRFMPQINGQLSTAADGTAVDTKVLAGFKLGDLTPETFTFKTGQRAGETGIALKTRLLRITWVRINGELVYTAPTDEPEQVDQDEPSDVDVVEPEQAKADAGSDDQTHPETPFDGDPGDTVSLDKSDPEFEVKKAWLKNNGYGWNPGQKAWVRKQAA